MCSSAVAAYACNVDVYALDVAHVPVFTQGTMIVGSKELMSKSKSKFKVPSQDFGGLRKATHFPAKNFEGQQFDD